MNNVIKLNIKDQSGALRNINDLLEEVRNKNIDSFAIVYTRKSDQSTRTYTYGCDRISLVGTLEQLKFDVLEGSEIEFTSYEEGP